MGFVPFITLMSEPARDNAERAFEVLADILTWPLRLIPSINASGKKQYS